MPTIFYYGQYFGIRGDLMTPNTFFILNFWECKAWNVFDSCGQYPEKLFQLKLSRPSIFVYLYQLKICSNPNISDYRKTYNSCICDREASSIQSMQLHQELQWRPQTRCWRESSLNQREVLSYPWHYWQWLRLKSVKYVHRYPIYECRSAVKSCCNTPRILPTEALEQKFPL